MARYKVISESQSGHCCFVATVVDTSKPLNPFRNFNGDKLFKQVCETFELKDAKLICQALNIMSSIKCYGIIKKY